MASLALPALDTAAGRGRQRSVSRASLEGKAPACAQLPASRATFRAWRETKRETKQEGS